MAFFTMINFTPEPVSAKLARKYEPLVDKLNENGGVPVVPEGAPPTGLI